MLASAITEISHGGHLVADLGIVTVAAAFAAIIFHRLKMPVILGYVLAGILIGPHLLPFHFIEDEETIRQLSELGVVFLLFSIGLEFDLRRLQSVLGAVMLALILQTVVMLFLGLQFGRLMGWDTVPSIFMGSLLAISSSMVTVRVLRDQERLKHPHAQLAVGILILEDILAVILLVLLSGVAVTGELDWAASLRVSFFIGVFVVAIFWVGKVIAPKVINVLHKIGSIELITLFALAMTLGIGYLALKAQFSVALGAFLAGAILSQSKLAHEIEHSTIPMRDVFGAVFFVAVGMMIDPSILITKLHYIVVLSLFVIAFKVISCWLGLFLSGQPARSSFRGACAKAQIGEFSFIILNLGQTLGVTDERVSAVGVGVALVTIMATPFVSGPSEGIFRFLAARMPRPLVQFGDFYRRLYARIAQTASSSLFLRLARRPALQVTVWFFLFNGLLIIAALFSRYLINNEVDYAGYLMIGLWLVTAVGVAPFAVAIVRNLNVIVMLISEATLSSTSSGKALSGRIRNHIQNLILGLVILLTGSIYVSVMAQYTPRGAALAIFLLLVLVIGALFWRQMIELNSRLELLFLEGFQENTREIEEKHRDEVMKSIAEKYPWPVEISEFEVRSGMGLCGQRISDINLRSATGCTLIAIGRGGHTVFEPSPETSIFPGDKLTLLGSPEQIQKARTMLSSAESRVPWTPRKSAKIILDKVYIHAECELDGNTLAGANVRRLFGVNVVGVQRGEERISPPPPDFIIKQGDVLLAVGQESAFKRFQAFCGESSGEIATNSNSGKELN